MGCQKKERGEVCGHHQCPFKEETTHGYECVDILYAEIDGVQVGFCEVGQDCLDKCPFSFKKGADTPAAKAAEKWNAETQKELEEYSREYQKDHPA